MRSDRGLHRRITVLYTSISYLNKWVGFISESLSFAEF